MQPSNFLDATASYFLKSSKGKHWQQAQEQHRQQNAMQMANEITKGSLCDTFCVLRLISYYIFMIVVLFVVNFDEHFFCWDLMNDLEEWLY